jgi:NAD(P)-dependent dehydrogenase (short-subunit alcohol dehydrogenase family)
LTNTYLNSLFSLEGQAAAVTGATGVLGSELARGLAKAGAKVAILGRNQNSAAALAAEIEADGGEALVVACDVLDRGAVQAACEEVNEAFGKIDILVNGAGGNQPGATVSPDLSFFDLPPEALEAVFDLNLLGTLYPCQAFGAQMAKQRSGVILNISSMAAYRPLTRVVAYAAAKAAVSNFTAWLAVYLAKEFSPEIRVNAIAPGFFLTKQNVFLLTNQQTGALSPRGQMIIAHTPAGRFGDPQDLVGTVIWLVSPAARFVTGVVVPVDGGFNAYSGV